MAYFERGYSDGHRIKLVAIQCEADTLVLNARARQIQSVIVYEEYTTLTSGHGRIWSTRNSVPRFTLIPQLCPAFHRYPN